MIGLVLIAVVIVVVLVAYWPKNEQHKQSDIPNDTTAQEWIDAEERGELVILDDYGTDHPTVEIRQR